MLDLCSAEEMGKVETLEGVAIEGHGIFHVFPQNNAMKIS